MTTRATLVCTAALKTAADDLSASFDGGEGTFSVELTSNSGGARPPEYYAGSGVMSTDMYDAFVADGRFEVLLLEGTTTFWQQMAAHTPPLYRCIPEE